MTVDRRDMVRCRTYGHAWEEVDVPFTVPIGSQRVWQYRLSLRCIRCTTVRHDVIDAYGDVAGRWYDYPEGYGWAIDDLPTRSEFRLMLLKPRENR